LKLKVSILAGIIIAGLVGVLAYFITLEDTISNATAPLEISPVNLTHKGEGNITEFPGSSSIFRVFAYDSDIAEKPPDYPEFKIKYRHVELKPENADLYREIGIADDPQKTVFVIPIFTISAYVEPGFYTYFKGECGLSCLSIPIRYDEPPRYTSSDDGIKILRLLGYPYITDIEVDKNPGILDQYDKVILLHNEYVTRNEFDAITNHPNVIYLYPNALYAEVKVNYENDTISLVRGHNYPYSEIKNGFDWEFDNTYPYEHDTDCKDWEFYEIKNGWMLNCYPENKLHLDESLLKTIKEF